MAEGLNKLHNFNLKEFGWIRFNLKSVNLEQMSIRCVSPFLSTFFPLFNNHQSAFHLGL